MVSNKFIHLYLDIMPEEHEIQTLLEFYGFNHIKTDNKLESTDPAGSHYSWKHPPLSDEGFKLIYFDGIYPDDFYYGTYGCFVVLEGSKRSSKIDLAYLDVVAKFLLDRFGGIIHNPMANSSSMYLCGQTQQ